MREILDQVPLGLAEVQISCGRRTHCRKTTSQTLEGVTPSSLNSVNVSGPRGLLCPPEQRGAPELYLENRG